jgi:hypothetical protein
MSIDPIHAAAFLALPLAAGCEQFGATDGAGDPGILSEPATPDQPLEDEPFDGPIE